MTQGDFASLIDAGLVRDNNEDAALAQVLDDGRVLLIVADGVGGAAAGEVASALAVDVAVASVAEAGPTSPPQALAGAIEAANRAVWEQAASEPALRGMATTIVVAIVDGERAWLQHAGDSRAYLFDGQALEPLTEDHRMVIDMVHAGQITAEEARTHPYRNVITRAVGIEEGIEPGPLTEVALAPGAVLLLCTDGLTDPVDEAEIAAILRQGGTATSMAQALVERAKASGGPDNIGIALYHTT